MDFLWQVNTPLERGGICGSHAGPGGVISSVEDLVSQPI